MKGLNCPPSSSGNQLIKLGHGSGGRMTANLIQNVFLPKLKNEILGDLEDAAAVEIAGARLAFTTDAFVVKPIFFPGGDIGKLAVCGTVNDLAMRGAKPLYLTASFILEEGLDIGDLERIMESFETACSLATVKVIAADTKVVNRGACDQIYISCAGIGILQQTDDISCRKTKAGDIIIVSGDIGRHGIAVMTAREKLDLEVSVQTDCAPLNKLVEKLLARKCMIHSLRDITRGGLAGVLNEIAVGSSVQIEVDETKIPLHREVKASCELLGLDPLYVACEGRMVIAAPAEAVDSILEILRNDELGFNAEIIGTAQAGQSGLVTLKTVIGGRRILDLLSGEQLPRIC